MNYFILNAMAQANIPPGILIESHYLPCIEYFTVVSHFDQIIWEIEEHYVKQSYRNRCRILTAQGPYELSIPIRHQAPKMKLKDVQIDYRQKWVNHHWRSIRSAYGKAPFFEHYAEMFEAIYRREIRFLVDLNYEFFDLCQKLLGMKFSLIKNQSFTHEAPAGIQDWRSKIHPKKALKINPLYKPCNYNQIFGQKFVANCSIIDLLFCEGPAAGNILMNSR